MFAGSLNIIVFKHPPTDGDFDTHNVMHTSKKGADPGMYDRASESALARVDSPFLNWSWTRVAKTIEPGNFFFQTTHISKFVVPRRNHKSNQVNTAYPGAPLSVTSRDKFQRCYAHKRLRYLDINRQAMIYRYTEVLNFIDHADIGNMVFETDTENEKETGDYLCHN